MRRFALAIVAVACFAAAALAQTAPLQVLLSSKRYLLFDEFSRYPNSAVMQSATPEIGPVWNTTGACTVTTSGGKALCTTVGTGYLYADFARPPQAIVSEVSFSGGTDLTQKNMTQAFSTDIPFTLNDLLHCNYGPLAFNVTVRQAGGSFISVLNTSWNTPMSNDGVVHKIVVAVSGNTLMVSKDDKEFHYVTDPRVSVLQGSVAFWEPQLESDGLQAQVSRAYALASSGFVYNQLSNYMGPGDVKPGAVAWWGLRAYSRSYISFGFPVANVCNAGDVNCADVGVLINGNFDVTSAQGPPLNCGGTGGTCTIKVLYDQTQGTACGGTVCDMTQTTAAQRPVLTFNCLGSLPCMTSSTATGTMATLNGTSSIAQPYTITGAVQRTGNFTVQNTVLSNGGGTNGLYFQTTGNADLLVNNVNNAFPASNSAWHALQIIGNGTTSSGTTDGSTTAISAATTAFTSASVMRSFNDTSPPGDAMVGTVGEFGVWASGFSGADLTAMNSNIHSYWGF